MAAMRGKDILTQATVWMDLEVVMLSDKRKSQKDKYCVIPFIGGPWSYQIHRD